ncbi:MAG: hypothetical protein NTW86_20680, partial [Candidatus Sumerlaeota bacterium]|nr:hypothetical protein [Candidatus Sumerlaeota bacterium]
MAGAEETPSEPLIAPPLVPETRLLCLALSRNGERDALRQAAQWAARAGFNGVITPLLLGGLPTFPSPAPRNYGLPPAIPGFRRRDPLGEIAEAAREAGLRLFGAL